MRIDNGFNARFFLTMYEYCVIPVACSAECLYFKNEGWFVLSDEMSEDDDAIKTYCLHKSTNKNHEPDAAFIFISAVKKEGWEIFK